jgi:hypothetical protein
MLRVSEVAVHSSPQTNLRAMKVFSLLEQASAPESVGVMVDVVGDPLEETNMPADDRERLLGNAYGRRRLSRSKCSRHIVELVKVRQEIIERVFYGRVHARYDLTRHKNIEVKSACMM